MSLLMADLLLLNPVGSSLPLLTSLVLLILIIIGGILITSSVHLIPVGGAPAAMAQATGVGTGTTQLAAGAGLTGLLVTASVSTLTDNFLIVLLLGGIGSAIMISLVMLISNAGYIYGVGCPPASGKAARDPITKDRQDIYVSKGTEGHGVPTVCFVSGLIGGFFGGVGGALIFESLSQIGVGGLLTSPYAAVSLITIISIAIFFVNAVIASYNIGGTIEGFHDPKIKKLPRCIFVSAVVTFFCGLLSLIAFYNLGGFA
ncbi:MAG: tetrahydromethanopterin S-methyltransferase subunit D [Methanimicrococcus sp.]|nr:tetrahydromethanopterin S-methyltransferase subunit D [Methanimicrococcus sp.]